VLLLSALLISTNVRNAFYQTSAFICTTLVNSIRDFVTAFVAYVNAGLFFAVVWVSLWMGEDVHYAVLDWGKRKGVCGNKFMECRTWD
jgi:hypothetical protein